MAQQETKCFLHKGKLYEYEEIILEGLSREELIRMVKLLIGPKSIFGDSTPPEILV